MPSFMPNAMSEIVGGPPMITGGPVGIGSTTLKGATRDLILPFFFRRNGATMPMHWQLRAGSAM